MKRKLSPPPTKPGSVHRRVPANQAIPTQHLGTVCVCVCFLPIHSGHQVRWTYQPGSHRRKVTQDFSGFLIHLLSAVRALIFLARRIQPFLSLVDREVEFLCTNDLIVLHPLGILFLFFSFLVRKIPFAGIELTSQRVRGLRGTTELPGRPASVRGQKQN